MQNPLRKQPPREFVAAARSTSSRFRWLWVAVAVCSALLLSGWPLPQAASGGSTSDARAFQVFPSAFTDDSTSTVSRGSAVAPALDDVRVGFGFQAPVDELAETHDLLVRYWTTERVTSQPAVVASASGTAPSLPQNVAQTVAAPTVPESLPVAVKAPEAEPEIDEPLAAVQPSVPVVSGTAPLAFSVRERGLFDAMNVERLANGLPALIAKDMLTEVGRARSEEMTRLDYFAHFYAGGTSAYDFLRLAGARFSTAGENLAKVGGADSESVATAIRALMESPTHRANILDPDFVRVGVGAVTSDEGITIFTMIYTDR